MSTFSKIAFASAVLAQAATGQVLAPANDLLFPSSSSASNPLEFAGANSPWFQGPDLFGLSTDVPDGCIVQQAAYVVRHGSRFPDSGSYESWVGIQERIQAAVAQNNLTATGSLSFIPEWKTALSNSTLQLSQESMTGYKELHDLGYQLRARYPDFYEDGNPFMVWANQYAAPVTKSRVVQSAQAFLQGYLYIYAQAYGTIVSINSTGASDALGRSLSPSDLCPAYTNNDGNNVTDWDNVWVPAALERLNSLITGNLTFDETDILFFPYLCGYESQILGHLSPWCGVFTDDELASYQYSQDLAYYYGVGPGSTGAASKVFLPFLDGLMSLFMEGPGQQGQGLNGTTFTVPNLVMSFLNDDQIAEMTAAMGIFDNDAALPLDAIPENRLYNVAHFITMRGTVAFEVLNCNSSAILPSSSASISSGPISTPSSATSSKMPSSLPVNNSSLTTSSGAISETPSSSSAISGTNSARTASGHSTSSPHGTITTIHSGMTTITVTASPSNCAASTSKKTYPTNPSFKRSVSTNTTYIRVLFNDAVYPIANCQDGPGNSCLLSQYADFIHQKNGAAGEFKDFCNVTTANAPMNINGAGFFTDLTLDYLTFLKPFFLNRGWMMGSGNNLMSIYFYHRWHEHVSVI